MSLVRIGTGGPGCAAVCLVHSECLAHGVWGGSSRGWVARPGSFGWSRPGHGCEEAPRLWAGCVHVFVGGGVCLGCCCECEWGVRMLWVCVVVLVCVSVVVGVCLHCLRL